MLKRIALAAAMGALLGSAVAVTPAQAATGQNGVCEPGEFCLYFNSGQKGSVADLARGFKTYGTGADCVKFVSAGAGQGKCVKNEAASAWNRESSAVTVFRKSGWAGAIQGVAAGARVNLNSSLKNENAGHVIDSASANLPGGLYAGGGGRISSYFDGYLVTSGRHEGIDMVKGIGSPVHSLLNGTVTNVVSGALGSSGLSTIAIYNAAQNKTIVYLHAAPSSAVRVGSTVSRGQVIANESWRGISSSQSAHTHVEMREGRQTHAAKSVGDETLSNPNPTQFWLDRGYNPCCD